MGANQTRNRNPFKVQIKSQVINAYTIINLKHVITVNNLVSL